MNSQYKIGDISRLFNLSSEMIRYYEKMGIIDPIRDEKNGYRYYSIFDIYILLECLLILLILIIEKSFKISYIFSKGD